MSPHYRCCVMLEHGETYFVTCVCMSVCLCVCVSVFASMLVCLYACVILRSSTEHLIFSKIIRANLCEGIRRIQERLGFQLFFSSLTF